MPKRKSFKFGHKMPRKSWKSSEIDQAAEDKKIMILFLSLFAFMLILLIFMWWIKH